MCSSKERSTRAIRAAPSARCTSSSTTAGVGEQPAGRSGRRSRMVAEPTTGRSLPRPSRRARHPTAPTGPSRSGGWLCRISASRRGPSVSVPSSCTFHTGWDRSRSWAHTDWVYGGRFHEVFGRASYKGRAIYGFQSTARGEPTDNFGRLIYLDTFNSPYGPGWRRENSFLPHRPTGVYCYGFFRHNPRVGGYAMPPGYKGGRRGPGNGKSYRLTITGPGVTPDVQVVVDGLGDYNRTDPADVAYEHQQNAVLDQLAAGGRQCHHH